VRDETKRREDERLNTNHKLAVAVLAGVSIGVTAAQAIHAQQAKAPPAYLIAEVEKDSTKTADPIAARKYGDEAPKTILAFDGRYVVRGGAVQTLEGDAPKGYIVVIAFDSMEKARSWYNSPAYEAIKPIRQNSTRSRLLLVEGVVPQ
jgi:uncharacterized protein (DUF1330 family)